MIPFILSEPKRSGGFWVRLPAGSAQKPPSSFNRMTSLCLTRPSSRSTRPGSFCRPRKRDAEGCRKSASMNRTFWPEYAVSAASDNAMVVLPSPGAVDVT